MRERYWRVHSDNEKSGILDEYCAKYRTGEEVLPLEGFDYPCGHRLKPLLKLEVDRLIALGELNISGEVVAKLKRMSSAIISIGSCSLRSQAVPWGARAVMLPVARGV
ncbi:MAG: hypothetical protein A2Y91_04095 [Chloroflexi bacterium RBG_13_54_8]|nr:MAG: hypothetical protein A2Y91_04095 [Chloroflexi bacterium RBG_13_54_8]